MGLLCGNPEREITGVLICHDALESVVEEAVQKNANVILTFHPIIFSGLKSITGKNYVEKAVLKAIENKIAIIALHTALDNHYFGVNHRICKELGLDQLKVLIPKLPEQQKIADCLSSIDDLISAEEKKLSLLNDYKKGWMQKLFPAEGKTFPEWKFPEFGDNDGWMEKKLGEIGEPLMCKRVFKEQTSKDSKNGVPFYKIGTFENEADSFIPIEIYEEYKNKYSFPKSGDILISASGTIGRSVVYNGSPAYFQDTNIVWIDNNERQIINQFLYYCYSNLKWQTSDGGTVRRLYNSNLKNMVISYPKNIKEQKKIANFLSGINDLINRQTDKIEALKQHKKALMQGLFPSIEEVCK